MRRMIPWIAAAGGAVVLAGCASLYGNSMSFFITSANPGKGGDLGGLAGADQHCQRLAEAVGAGGRTWRAYLSAPATGSRVSDWSKAVLTVRTSFADTCRPSAATGFCPAAHPLASAIFSVGSNADCGSCNSGFMPIAMETGSVLACVSQLD